MKLAILSFLIGLVVSVLLAADGIASTSVELALALAAAYPVVNLIFNKEQQQ